MKKIIILTCIGLLLTMMNLDHYGISLNTNEIKTLVMGGSDLRYCWQNSDYHTVTDMNECERWHQYLNECIYGNQSMQCTTQHIAWVDNWCDQTIEGPWDIGKNETLTCIQ